MEACVPALDTLALVIASMACGCSVTALVLFLAERRKDKDSRK